MSVQETMRGADDAVVLECARSESRLIITFDKDCGELAFRFGLSASSGVILFRLSGSSPELDNARAMTALESDHDWTGHFAVVTDSRIRMRPLPGPRRRTQRGR